MNEEVRAWVAKAEGDYEVALREFRARKAPCHDAVCFHAQQCIEKYLKAVAAKNRIAVRRIHDLVPLLQPLTPFHPLWIAMTSDLEMLSQYAVKFRYPGESATRVKARAAAEAMKRCRCEIREGLGLGA
ncbi:MAG: HEPN domain-containing protein [bacterium]